MLPAVKNVLSPSLIKDGDRFTIKHQGIRSIDLMERAAAGLAQWISEAFSQDHQILIFCGNGNNGGDGLALQRLLEAKGYRCKGIVVSFQAQSSPDFDANLKRLNPKVLQTFDTANLPPWPSEEKTLVVDALVGIGLNRPPEGQLLQAIQYLNTSPYPIVAIDIPSGLYAEIEAQEAEKYSVKARFTLSFEAPKKVFLWNEYRPYVGDWHCIPIGIAQEFYSTTPTNLYFTTPKTFALCYRPVQSNAHKGTQGHLLLIAGQKGMLGAALLAAKAALHCGLGKLTIHAPEAAEVVLQTGVPEALFLPNPGVQQLAGTFTLNYAHIAVGPGIGQANTTVAFIQSLLQNASTPLVVDADAINILGAQPELLNGLPKNSILTPHPKEFDRLDNKQHTSVRRLEAAKQWAVTHHCYLVLKGASTITFCPDGKGYINCSGNAGLATAGSGDVLTGIIGSLLAQGYPPKTAAVLGVYIHGRAADNFVKRYPKPLLTAALLSDLLAPVIHALEQDNMS